MNTAGQPSSVKRMNRLHFGLGLFFTLKSLSDWVPPLLWLCLIFKGSYRKGLSENYRIGLTITLPVQWWVLIFSFEVEGDYLVHWENVGFKSNSIDPCLPFISETYSLSLSHRQLPVHFVFFSTIPSVPCVLPSCFSRTSTSLGYGWKSEQWGKIQRLWIKVRVIRNNCSKLFSKNNYPGIGLGRHNHSVLFNNSGIRSCGNLQGSSYCSIA